MPISSEILSTNRGTFAEAKVRMNGLLDQRLGCMASGSEEVTIRDLYDCVFDESLYGRTTSRIKAWANKKGTIDRESAFELLSGLSPQAIKRIDKAAKNVVVVFDEFSWGTRQSPGSRIGVRDFADRSESVARFMQEYLLRLQVSDEVRTGVSRIDYVSQSLPSIRDALRTLELDGASMLARAIVHGAGEQLPVHLSLGKEFTKYLAAQDRPEGLLDFVDDSSSSSDPFEKWLIRQFPGFLTALADRAVGKKLGATQLSGRVDQYEQVVSNSGRLRGCRQAVRSDKVGVESPEALRLDRDELAHIASRL